MQDRKKRKILHIVGDSKYGGGSYIILRLANMVKQYGWDVDVLTTDSTFQDMLRNKNIGVVQLDVIWRDIRPIRDTLGLLQLTRFLKNNRYDIVHTHTSKAGVIGRLAARLSRCPAIIHTVHGFSFHEESSLFAVKIYSCIERIAAHWCDRIVTVSEFHRQWALQLKIGKKHKIVAVPNGIEENSVIPNKSKLEVRKLIGVSPEELVILSHGRLAPQKGLEYLIRSIPVLKREMCQPFKIVVPGDGPFRTHLEKLAKELNVSEYVMFLGFTREINNLLSACDIVVLPSLREGLSISLLEAMAAGKPIITTSIGSNREVTRDGEGAFLIPPKDHESIARAIAQVAHDKILSDKLAVAGRDLFKAQYRESMMVKKYSDIYSSLIMEKAHEE